MRIVSWNCRCPFDENKAETIKRFNADILVVQECLIADFNCEKAKKEWNSYDWYADGTESTDPRYNRGIGIFCKSEFKSEQKFDKNDTEMSEFRYVLPYSITGYGQSLTLFAVWTKGGYKNYHKPIFDALEYYQKKKLLADIIIGDFNTGSCKGSDNAHWYEELKYKLAKNDLVNCAANQEWVPTFYKGKDSLLDDHCFASEGLYKNVISFSIGNPNYWSKYSDHCPIIVDFDFQ
jgi:exonuclease III